MTGPLFAVPLVLIALMLGTWAQPPINVFNVSARGVGIVHVYRLLRGALATARATVRSAFSWRSLVPFGALAVAVLAVHLGHPTSATGAIIMGAVSPPPQGTNFLKVLQAYKGRNQGPELFDSFAHDGTVSTINPSRNLSINRPLEAFIFQWRGRVVVGAANYTNAAAESPMTILNQVQITGTFKGGNQTPLKMSGATLFSLTSCFANRGSSCYINGIRQASPTLPFAQTLANFGNTGTYDVEINYVYPVWPMVAGANRAATQIPFLWQPEDWGNTIQFQFDLGDKTAFGTPACGTTVAFTAYGSGAGTPTFSIYTRYVLLGSIRPNNPFQTSLVQRNESMITAGMDAIGTGVLLKNLTKQKTTNILLKVGLLLSGTSNGVQVLSALDDLQIDKTLITVDGTQIRKNQNNMLQKESVGFNFGSVLPQGYFDFTFIDSQDPRSAFRADLPDVVSPGSSYLLTTDVLKTGAQQRVWFTDELIIANAQDPFWLGTR
jgi:hypothetical protein